MRTHNSGQHSNKDTWTKQNHLKLLGNTESRLNEKKLREEEKNRTHTYMGASTKVIA